jgi:glycosyltransferase involved in cell wall biosynthesis
VSKFAFNLPLNSTSLGQVSFSILRELFNRKENIHLFPIGGVDISAQAQDKDFFEWLQKAIHSAALKHKKTDPIFKLWHINGSLESFSNDQVLLSFYEVDTPTAVELNIIKNNKQLLLSSNYSVDIFKTYGIDNVNFIPLAFDKTHFKKKSFSLKKEGIQFGLFGKLEPQRKRHLKVLENWVKKYGNKQGYFLNCAIYNNFLDPNMQTQIIQQALKGEKYWNVNFLGYMPSNEIYNDVLNNTDIVIAMSGGEGWGLPEFQTVALGKHCIGLNAHAYKDWMTSENTVLVAPSSKIPCYDNIFFKEGSEFNQGNIFDWGESEFLSGLDKVEARYKANPINEEGLKLQQKFTYEKMVDSILEIMKKI